MLNDNFPHYTDELLILGFGLLVFLWGWSESYVLWQLRKFGRKANARFTNVHTVQGGRYASTRAIYTFETEDGSTQRGFNSWNPINRRPEVGSVISIQYLPKNPARNRAVKDLDAPYGGLALMVGGALIVAMVVSLL